jgi:hypothetical protein
MNKYSKITALLFTLIFFAFMSAGISFASEKFDSGNPSGKKVIERSTVV